MLVAIDFETYFNKNYNLKKIKMIEYLYDPQFEVLGAAVLIPEQQYHAFLPAAELEIFLETLDPETTEILAHNTLFDGAILAWHYGFNPRYWLDSLSMARAKLPLKSHSLESLAKYYKFPPKGELNTQDKHWDNLTLQERLDLSTYAKHDIWLSHEIYKKLSPYPDDELKLIDLTIRLFTEPKLQLNLEAANALLEKEKNQKTTHLQSTGLTSTQLNSNQQLARLIQDYGLEPPTKISPRTGKETFAFAKNDEAFQEFLENTPDELRNVLTARLSLKSTIIETRLESLITTQQLTGSLPVPLTYHGAHTGRWSGRGAGLNMQNLPKREGFRELIIAPPGHQLVIADSASIEARVLAWLAGQEDLLQIFHNKGDPYKNMASEIYNRPINTIEGKERTLGKVAVLGCGYGMGVPKFIATAKSPFYNLVLEYELAEIAVKTYRKTNNAIVDLWRFLGTDMLSLMTRTPGAQKHSMFPGLNLSEHYYKCLTFKHQEIILPNGLSLHYPNLRFDSDSENYIYDTKRKIYGGALCLAKDTLVLTQNGPKPLINITKKDKLWDGQTWITHGGLIFKGLKQTINFGNIYMTPDHRVLTKNGWCKANDTTLNDAIEAYALEKQRPNRRPIRNPIRSLLRGLQKREKSLASTMFALQKAKDYKFYRPKTSQIMRLFSWILSWKKKLHPWYEYNPHLRRLASYDRPMPLTHTSSVEELWGARYKSMPRMGLIRAILYGYERYLQTWTHFRSNRQQWRLFQRQRPLDNISRTMQQQEEYTKNPNPNRIIISRPSSQALQYRRNNPTLSPEPKYTHQTPIRYPRCEEPVYDILNCGPNNRFTVMNPAGDKILVHNCENVVQALARIVISDQVLKVKALGYHIAHLVHDEIVCCVPETQAEQCLEDLLNIMCQPPLWAQDMPLDAEGAISPKYIKP